MTSFNPSDIDYPIMRTRLAAILVVLLMVGWPLTIAGSAGAATAENPALSGSTVEANFIEEGDDQFTNVSDDLIVWERSFKPLRADTTASSAKTVIENHAINVVDNRSGVFDDTTANRPETAIFDKVGQSLLSSQTFLVLVRTHLTTAARRLSLHHLKRIKIPLMSEVPIN